MPGQEISEYENITAYLVKFTTSADEYHYSSGDLPLAFGGDTYTPVPMESGSIDVTGKVEQAGVSFRMSINDIDGNPIEIPRINIIYPYPSSIGLAIYKVSISDVGGVVDNSYLWNGVVKSIRLEGNEAVIEGETLISAMRKRGLTDRFQSLCNFYLYVEMGGRCPVLMANHERTATVTDIDENTITVSGVSSFADDWFKAGFAKTSNGDTRDILGNIQSTGVITLTAAFPSTTLGIGDTILLYDGCDHTYATCKSVKFSAETDNGEAFGGFPFSPDKNPHSQTGIQ